MKLTIIPNDGAVYINNYCYLDLALSGIPTNVHALQWNETKGWIEYTDEAPNEDITELPSWTSSCITLWNEAKAEEEAAIAKAAEEEAAKVNSV